MHHPYYIKMVDGPFGQTDQSWKEGEDCNIHFAAEQHGSCQHFAESTGFLVYETLGEDRGQPGAQRIFARGSILSLECKDVWDEDPRESNGTRFPLGVKAHIDRRVNPHKGIDRDEVYRLCPRLRNHFGQAHGGLIGITLEEFKALSAALDAC